ncbi:hypothetical protein HMPREF1549_01856 [Actinomyces johnsonii F0510]|uniref:Uncharacterized protein n=1 Tax=Actinomyces johnsonii F0510 TaxID=1227262 RepID=U1RF65_9ACTO|nr:hypothetical protein HMPREF1549_01856 [Actinomyces johnsonii F0510]
MLQLLRQVIRQSDAQSPIHRMPPLPTRRTLHRCPEGVTRASGCAVGDQWTPSRAFLA